MSRNKVGHLVTFLLITRLLNYSIPYLIWWLVFNFTGNPGNITLSWNRWDAPHYLYLAANGYTSVGDEANFIVFQPLFPLFTRLANILIPNYEIAGIVLSISLFIAGGVLLYKAIRIDYGEKVAWLTVVLVSLFPTAYFFNAPYTESQFFFFISLLLYLAKKKQWILAGVAGGLAVLTRHVGLFLLIPLGWEMIRNRIKNPLPYLAAILSFGIAFSLYLYVNYAVFGDPFAFQTILHEHWYKTFSPFWKSIWGSWQASRAWPPTQYSLMIGLSEALPATIAVILILPILKLKNFGSWLYYTIYILFICSTSFLMSTPRYLLMAFPLFILFAKVSVKLPILLYLWLFISTSLLTFFSLQFLSGQWAF